MASSERGQGALPQACREARLRASPPTEGSRALSPTAFLSRKELRTPPTHHPQTISQALWGDCPLQSLWMPHDRQKPLFLPTLAHTHTVTHTHALTDTPQPHVHTCTHSRITHNPTHVYNAYTGTHSWISQVQTPSLTDTP